MRLIDDQNRKYVHILCTKIVGMLMRDALAPSISNSNSDSDSDSGEAINSR